MFRKQIKFASLVCIVALISCHSTNNKESVKSVPLRDTGKTAVQKEVKKTKSERFVILDTVVNKDTIKFVLYRDSMIRCSLNNLSDTLDVGHSMHAWDSTYGDCGLIVVPGKEHFQKFILNNSVLIIPITYGYFRWDGGVSLYLLNRTKASLKFADTNKDNPINASSCPYVDLKTNNIMTYDYHPYYDFEDAGQCQLDHARWQVDRYKIMDKKFVETYYVAASSKELDDIDVFSESDSAEKAFYAYMSHYKYWERDRFDSSIYQRVVILDTIAGRDTISVSYDNKGIITAVLNEDTDTYDWDRTWIGNEWWRGKEDYKMIVPGGKRPVSYILNDTMLVLSLNDLYRYASLFVLKRYCDSLIFINDQLSTAANYVYVDIKRNIILAFGSSDYSDSGGTNTEKVKYPYKFDKYKIYNKYFVNTETGEFVLNDKNAKLPSSFEDSKDLYMYICADSQKRESSQPSKKVIDFIKKYFSNWYFYYSLYLIRN